MKFHVENRCFEANKEFRVIKDNIHRTSVFIPLNPHCKSGAGKKTWPLLLESSPPDKQQYTMLQTSRCCTSLGKLRAKLLWEVISDLTYTERFSQPNWRAEQSGEHAIRQQPADFINKEGFLLGWGFCLFVWVWFLLLLLFCRLGFFFFHPFLFIHFYFRGCGV